MKTLSPVGFQAKGVYYKAGEGPPLEELDDVWSAWFLWSQTDTWEPNTLGVQLSGVVDEFK